MSLDASAPPVRERGLRSRAGNAMARTRAAVLDGTVAAIAANGARKTTMADIASSAGIAKGTLYNHFRTKEAVFAATIEAAVERLASESADAAQAGGLADGLAQAAREIARSPALARLADEPAALLPLARIGDGGVWDLARQGVGEVLRAGGQPAEPASVELVLRWLVSQVVAPADDSAIAGAAGLIADTITGSRADGRLQPSATGYV